MRGGVCMVCGAEGIGRCTSSAADLRSSSSQGGTCVGGPVIGIVPSFQAYGPMEARVNA
jgi:hypothetical protein